MDYPSASMRNNKHHREWRGHFGEAPKDLHGSETVSPEKLDPGDHERCTPDHHVGFSGGTAVTTTHGDDFPVRLSSGPAGHHASRSSRLMRL
jgi:hypothetical protein